MEQYIQNDIIFLPPGETSVTALFIDFGYIWAALSNGRVAIFSTETYQIVRTLDLLDTKRVKNAVSIIQPSDIRRSASSCAENSDIFIVTEAGVIVVVDKLFYRPKREIHLFPAASDQRVTAVKVSARRVWVSSVALGLQDSASAISVVDPATLRLVRSFTVPGEHVSDIAPTSATATAVAAAELSDGGGGSGSGEGLVWCATKSGRLILVSADDGVVAEVSYHSPHKKSITNLFISQGKLWYLSEGKVCVVPTDDPALVPKVLYPDPDGAVAVAQDVGEGGKGTAEAGKEEKQEALTCLAPAVVSWEAGSTVVDFVVGVGHGGVTRMWNARDLGTEAVLKNDNVRLKTPMFLNTYYSAHTVSTTWCVANKENGTLHVYTLKKEGDALVTK